MRNKKISLITVPAVLIVCCITAFATVACTSEGDGNGAGEEGGTRANVNLVGPICQGAPLSDASSYTQASGTHSLVVLELESDGDYGFGFFNGSSYSLPDGWRARYVEDLELVVCVDQEEDALVEECQYTFEDGSGTATLSRYSTQVTFRLLEAQTGQEVAADTLVGMPGECQDTEEFLEDTTGASMYGDVYEELEDWLRSYVEVP
jgi:hypothetical protein